MKRAFFIIPSSITSWRLPSISVGSLRARTRRNFILESCKGNSALPPKPFGHLKIQWDPAPVTVTVTMTHTIWTPRPPEPLPGNGGRAFGDGKPMHALSRSSAHHTAPFKHCRSSSNLPETYWLLSNVFSWCCHMSTIFHSHPRLRKIQHFLSQIQSFMLSFM